MCSLPLPAAAQLSASGAMPSQAAVPANYRPLDEMRRGVVPMPPPLAREVRLTHKRALLSRVLLDIANQADFGLSYGEDLAQSKLTKSIDLAHVSAADALTEAVRETPWLVFASPAGQVTIVKAAPDPIEDLASTPAPVETGDYPLPPRLAYDGRSTLARLRYTPVATLEGCQEIDAPASPTWAHDYPMSVQNLLQAASTLSMLDAPSDSIVLLRADDPELMKYPIAMVSEPGCWQPTRAEAKRLRAYLLKGGFLIADDFTSCSGTEADCGLAIRRFEAWMRRVLPGSRIVPLAASSPIFSTPFRVDPGTVPGASHAPAKIVGIYENNDSTKRLLMVANYGATLGRYWRYGPYRASDEQWSRPAFRLGLNYLIYGLSH